jgi:hypothetical protein
MPNRSALQQRRAHFDATADASRGRLSVRSSTSGRRTSAVRGRGPAAHLARRAKTTGWVSTRAHRTGTGRYPSHPIIHRAHHTPHASRAQPHPHSPLYCTLVSWLETMARSLCACRDDDCGRVADACNATAPLVAMAAGSDTPAERANASASSAAPPCAQDRRPWAGGPTVG